MDLLRRGALALGVVGFYLVAAVSYQASPPSVAYLVAASMVLTFGVFVLRHDPSDPIKRAFFLLCVTLATYTLAVYMSHVASSWGIERFEWAIWLLRNGGFFAPPALLLLMYRFAGSYKRMLRALTWVSLATMVPFMLLNLTGLYVTEYRRLQHTYVPANGRGVYAACAIVTIVWMLIACMMQVALILRSPSRQVRKQHVLFLIGEIAAIGPGVAGYIPAFKGSWFPSYAGALIALFPLILGVAVLRFDLFGIRVVIRRTLPYALGTTAVGAIYAASLGGLELLGAVAGGLPRGTNWLLFLAIMGFGFHPILEYLRRSLDRLFFRSEAELDRFLADAGPRYRDADSQVMLARMVATDARRALNLEAAVMLGGEAHVEYVQADPQEIDLACVVGMPLPGPDVGTVVSADESDRLDLGDSAPELADALSKARMRVAVMSGQAGRRGVLAVAGKRSDLEFAPPDLLFLRALVVQAEMASSSLRSRAVADDARALTKALFDVMTNPVALVDPKGSVLSSNPAFRSAFGSSARQGVIERVPDRILEHVTLPGPAEIETSKGTFLVSARAITGPGPEQRTLIVMTDVTDLRRLQEADRRRSALAEIGAAVSGINHEIMNILSPVGFYLRKAEDACRGGDAVAALSIVAERITALDRLSSELREYYKSPALSLRKVDVGKIVASVLSDLAGTAGPEWLPPGLSGLDISVLADPQKLKQVLLNIAKNAWEAMDASPERRWSVSASPEDGRARIQITDTGAGIPCHLQKRLFEPFFTMKEKKGTGLGLAVARRIVEAHGAEIAVDSVPGRGTTVTLRWPTATPEQSDGA